MAEVREEPLLVLAPTYGGNALLIWEVIRKTGRGWPSIILLALAYGTLEEGIMTQPLFNPNYVNAHLPDYGFVPFLGIALPWIVSVLTLHTVWSISIPIAFVEIIFLERRIMPWLGCLGLALTSLLFALGILLNTSFDLCTNAFIVPIPQLIGIVVAIVVLVIVAFKLKPTPSRFKPANTYPALNAQLVGIFSFATGPIFMLIPHPSSRWIQIILYLVLDMVVISLVIS